MRWGVIDTPEAPVGSGHSQGLVLRTRAEQLLSPVSDRHHGPPSQGLPPSLGDRKSVV